MSYIVSAEIPLDPPALSYHYPLFDWEVLDGSPFKSKALGTPGRRIPTKGFPLGAIGRIGQIVGVPLINRFSIVIDWESKAQGSDIMWEVQAILLGDGADISEAPENAVTITGTSTSDGAQVSTTLGTLNRGGATSAWIGLARRGDIDGTALDVEALSVRLVPA